MCKILQNRKSCSFYTFWEKNTHISGCKIVHLFTIATVTMHICTVTVTLLFIILYFFLSPLFCFVSLSLTHSSIPRRRRRRRRRRRNRPSQQPSTTNHHHCNTIPPTTTTATQNRQPPPKQHGHTIKSSKSF